MNNPEEYANINMATREDARAAVEKFSNILAEVKGSCLDIGSGTGDVAVKILLPKLHPDAKIVASDISKEMVEYARNEYRDNDRMSFLQLDIQTPNLPNSLAGKFDHVFSCYCLHWCRNMRLVLENIYDLVKPNATSLLIFCLEHRIFDAHMRLSTRPAYQSYMKEMMNYVPLYQYHPVSESMEMVQLLSKEVGFEIIGRELREKAWLYSPDEVKRIVTALSPCMKKMPDDCKRNFVDDMTMELKKIFGTPTNNELDRVGDRGILFRWNAIVLCLRKPVMTQTGRNN